MLAISSRLTVVFVSLLLATPAILFWLWLMIQPTTEALLCPEECRCEADGYYINCSDSGLSSIPSILPTHVRQIVLDGNSITDFVKGSFVARGLVDLQVLNADFCEIGNLELAAFSGLKNLTHLSLQGNKISDIILGIFKNISHLEHLDLSYNLIEDLESPAFSGLVNLKYLNLEGNKLFSFDYNFSYNLPVLQSLNLSRNRLESFPHLVSLTLKYLDVSKCYIDDLYSDKFENIRALEWLDISYNKLKTISTEILPNLPKLSTMYLHGNPLNCDCKLQKLWLWFKENQIQTMSLNLPLCDSPNVVHGFGWGVLQKGLCFDNSSDIHYNLDHKIKGYRYTTIEDMDWDTETKEWKNGSSRLKLYELLVSTFLFIFGTTGNVILIIIISCNKDMRTVPNMYILNLAISDVIYLTAIFSTHWQDNITWLRFDILCTVLLFCNRMSVNLTMNFVTVLSIWVYKLRVNPYNTRVSSQPAWRATVGTIFGVWILAALFAVPAARSQYTYVNSILIWRTTYYLYVIAFQILVSFVLPVFAICFFFTYGQYFAKKSSSLSVEKQNSYKNTAKFYAVLSVGFTIIAGFYHMAEQYFYSSISFDLSNYRFGFEFVSVYNLRYISFILQILLSIKSCLNSVVLSFTSPAFRRHFKRYLTSCCKTNSPPNYFELT